MVTNKKTFKIQKEYEESSTISKDEYKNLGYTVEDYDDGEYIGIKAKASYNSIDEICFFSLLNPCWCYIFSPSLFLFC